ncbi:MAG: GTP-binding protein [Calditrichaeota bacterium]|nr:MAG: GTP-binding protein [Calditrichota bacterium]
MVQKQFQCSKCNGFEYETDVFRAVGGGFAKIFDVQNKKFFTVTCTNCGYTEIYKGDTSTLGNIFDFFTN